MSLLQVKRQSALVGLDNISTTIAELYRSVEGIIGRVHKKGVTMTTTAQSLVAAAAEDGKAIL